jgi:3-deoxy-7-phosphoheptulonate synthase
MIIILHGGATDQNVDEVVGKLRENGYDANVSRGVERTIIGAVGAPEEPQKELLAERLATLPFVERVVPILKPYKLVSREGHPEPSTIPVGDATVGGRQLCVVAGPCAVESREQILATAAEVKAAGATMLRGGAFKPRTSPYDFQGLKEAGLDLLREARQQTGLPIVTELVDVRDLERVVEVADVLQLGTRNMQNFALLSAVGDCRTPVILKRGMSATLEEWLKAAEYLMARGNHFVILCERGIRTFETYTRNTLDLSAVPAVKELTHLPVFVDPSHGAGRRSLVAPLSLAAIAAGADGLLIEVHPQPEQAVSDAQQQLTPNEFAALMTSLRPIAEAVGREM